MATLKKPQLPAKKQATLFGNAKGTVLGESPVKSQQTCAKLSKTENEFISSSQSINESKSAEIGEANRVHKPRYHRCDPNTLTIHHWKRGEAKPFPFIEEINDQTDNFIEEIHKELHEEKPVVDDSSEPRPEIEQVDPIRILGQVTHVDPTHENPYDHNQSLWQSVRNFFKYFLHN